MTSAALKPVCERCGLCCNSYTVWMTNRSFDNDDLEIKKLIEYHRCIPIKNAKGEMGLHVPIPCIHLGKKDNKYFCKIHETRPKVCREYFCGKVIEKVLQKELNGICL